eukprot:jgi/Botrbrau1/20215/Bobra.31_1s0012.1
MTTWWRFSKKIWNVSGSSNSKLVNSFLSSRGICEDAASLQPILFREYLHDSLYHPTEGYFTRQGAPPVGSLPQPLDFSSLKGKDGYLEALHRLYKDLQVSWLTPSELFSPFYGQAIANFIVDRHRRVFGDQQPLTLYELGGGTGRLALDVCNHLRDSAPDLYSGLQYRSVEISPPLAASQEARVSRLGGHSCYQVEVRDGCGREGWGGRSLDPCYVLALELLDNLPHDRLQREALRRPWLQTRLLPSTGPGRVREVLEPVSDGLIRRCLETGDWNQRKPFWHRLLDYAAGEEGSDDDHVLFLPTGCQQLLETLHDARPVHCLVCVDFDRLPDTQIPGRNAPLVATTEKGGTTDHATPYVARGSADIFFPTDFNMLGRMYEAAGKRVGASSSDMASQHMKSREFMKRYANLVETTVSGGYNPLLQDYENTSFFIGERQ